MNDKEKDLQQQFKELQDKIQNEAIDKVFQLVENFYQKAVKSSYSLTIHEQQQVVKMYNMIKWVYENA